MLYSALLNRINVSIRSTVKVIKLRHNKNICNLRKRHGIDKLSKTNSPKNVIHNSSLYDLLEEEVQALSHGLDQHLPSNTANKCKKVVERLSKNNNAIIVKDVG